MAEEKKAEKKVEKKAEPAAVEGQEDGVKRPGIARLLSPSVIIVTVATLVTLGSVGFAFSKMGESSTTARGTFSSGEWDLGEFAFEASTQDGPAQITSAQFSLHIAILKEVDSKARGLLDTRKYRVQQDIEELLRQAYSGDFEDPILAELKRRLKEQINSTLDLRSIADVIITDLQIQRGGAPRVEANEEVESMPWEENEDESIGDSSL